MVQMFNNNVQNEKKSFVIEGMHCTSCALVINGALEDTDGVVSATTSYAKSVVEIEYDKSKIDTNELRKIITENGYTVKD